MGMFNRPANLTDTSQASDAPQHGASDDTRFVSSKTERTSSGRVKAADAPRDSRSSELAPASSLIVAVRTRPSVLALDPLRSSGRKDILRVMDARTVVVLDPDDSKLYLDKRVGRTKERRYTFDYAFGPENGNHQVYDKTAKLLIPGVLSGHNGTVFAYGATGSGKTHTMVGSAADPGMMVLSLKDVFDGVKRQSGEFKFEVTCSYLEVYNELIFDLLMPDGSPPLELRDGPGGGTAAGGGGMQSGGNQNGCVVFGLKKVKVSDRDEIMHLLNMGNARRKVEPTEANSVSSRSHAVLEINVERKALGGGDPSSPVLSGKLSLVDLAGSERASETRNFGNKLRDGANINKSLLALANCINALGKKQTNNTSSTSGDSKSAANGAANNNETSGKKVGYVPFRNSKLTRLLKESLSGNSRTCMVANVSCGADQYNHTINTLKYADRAKEIKTHVVQNLQTVETHLGEYRRLIDTLQGENSRLKETVRAMENGTAGFGKDASHRERASAATPVSKPTQSKEPPGTQPNRYREFLFRQPEQPGRSQNQGSAASNHKPATKHELDSLLNEFHENTEERLSFQKSLYEFEDEKIQTQRALTGFAHNSTKHRQLTRAVVEHEAACLRYRTEIDMADRAAGRILEKTKDVANASGDVSLYMGRPGSSSSSGSSLPFADALVDSLQRWRHSDCQREEQNFAVDLRESVIAEQRDAIDLLLTRIPKHEISEFFLETLRRLDLSDKRLAFWEHTFEPPGSNTGTPVAAAAKHITVTPPPRLAESAETQSRAGSGRRRRSSVETGNTTALTASAGEKFTHRRVTPTSALALSRESSGRSSASGSEGGLSVGSGSERASEGRGDVSRVSSGRAYSNHQRGVGGGAGGIGTVSAGVFSKRRKEKPPVSASAVHGVGSRLKALQLVRHLVDTDRDPRVAIGRSVAPMKARVSSAAPVTRAGGGSVVDLEKARDRRVRETTRGGSARLFASPHSPSARRPEIETPEAFIIARPGR